MVRKCGSPRLSTRNRCWWATIACHSPRAQPMSVVCWMVLYVVVVLCCAVVCAVLESSLPAAVSRMRCVCSLLGLSAALLSIKVALQGLNGQLSR